jgi:hypothetical protein
MNAALFYKTLFGHLPELGLTICKSKVKKALKLLQQEKVKKLNPSVNFAQLMSVHTYDIFKSIIQSITN